MTCTSFSLFQVATLLVLLSNPSVLQADELNSKPILAQLTAPLPGSDEEAERLCGNIIDPIRERRHTLQVAELEGLQAKINERIDLLEAKRAELEEWSNKREKFAKQASGMVVEVYANMPADAAAERLETIEGGLSAALLLKLKPRGAAAILSEMDKDKASIITRIMAASADTSTDGG